MVSALIPPSYFSAHNRPAQASSETIRFAANRRPRQDNARANRKPPVEETPKPQSRTTAGNVISSLFQGIGGFFLMPILLPWMMGGMAALAIAMPLVAKHVNPKYFPDKHRRAGQLRNPQEVARTLWNKVLKPLIRVFATPLKLLPLPKVKSFLIRGMVKVAQFFKKMGVGLFRCKAFKVPSGFLPRIGYAGSWAIVLLLMTLEKRLFGKLGFLAKPFQWILDWGIFKDKRAHAEEAFQEVVGKPLQNIVERLPGLNH